MPAKTAAPEYFTAEEAAAYLRISRRSIDRCAESTDPVDRLPRAKFGTKTLFRRAELDAWFERHMEA